MPPRKHREVVHAGCQQFGGSTRRTPIGLAHQNDRLLARGEFGNVAAQLPKRHVDGTWQVTRRSAVLLGLAHIDQQDAAIRQVSLQVGDVDPRWCLSAATEQVR